MTIMTDPDRDRMERLSDAAVHLVGIAAATAAVPALVWMGFARRGDAATITAVTLYGLCLIAMLTCSYIYNSAPAGSPRLPIYKRLDHSAIFFKIAGTFTLLAALTGGAGTGFLVGIWGVALLGTVLKIAAPDRLRLLGLCLYVGLGWMGFWAGQGIFGALCPEARQLVMAAGFTYTFGVTFYLWERLPFHTAIWHAFVVVGTALAYAAMIYEIARIA